MLVYCNACNKGAGICNLIGKVLLWSVQKPYWDVKSCKVNMNKLAYFFSNMLQSLVTYGKVCNEKPVREGFKENLY